MLAMVWPFGSSARFANTGGAQTRYAQTMRAFSSVLAALLGHTTRPGKTTEERMDVLDDNKAENVTEYTILLHGRFAGRVFSCRRGGGTGEPLLWKSGRYNLRLFRRKPTQSGH